MPVPEEFIRDPSVATGVSYSESKWIAEELIAVAAERTPLKPSVVRVTQLTGGLNGAWKESEWFPSMVSTSVALKCFPNTKDVSATISVIATSLTLVSLPELFVAFCGRSCRRLH